MMCKDVLKLYLCQHMATYFRAFLHSVAVPNLLSHHVLETLDLEMNATPKKIAVPDGPVSYTLGIFKALLILQNVLNIVLDILAVEKPPYDIIKGLFTLGALQARL